ncbi:hypothetical protein AAF712_006284 [Marasmius tenuissimus]|uniref:F-box domain-containing protein n=1 Tax=Marasmius tenuissimus TaxID=585030 RepID=A0ABR2ZY80_9AGAR
MDSITSRRLDERFKRSSYVPSEAERIHLATFLEQEATAQTQYEQENLILTARLAWLEERKRDAETSTACCRSALSVQRRLPVELWRTIFSIFCLELHEYTLSINFDTSAECLDSYDPIFETPTVTLSQVCQHWRSIITNDPTLWTSINIELNNLPHDVSTLLNIHFNNAGDRPPRISVVSVEDSPDGPWARAAWAILSTHIPRCRELEIWAYHLNFPPIPDLRLPNLETYIEKKPLHYLRQNSTLKLHQAIQYTAPKLSELVICDLHPGLPYKQITSFTFRDMDGRSELPRLLRILPTCSVLESMALREMDSSRVQPFTLDTQVPSLRRLFLTGGSSRYHSDDPILATLFMSLRSPKLQMFEVQCKDCPPTLLPFLQATSETLVRLHIRISPSTHTNRSGHPLISLLKSVPNLTHLRLELGWYRLSTDDASYPSFFLSTFLSGLRINAGTPAQESWSPFLPKLESLSLAFTDTKMVDEALDMVSPCNAMGTPTPTPTPSINLRLGVFEEWPSDDPPKVMFDLSVERRIWEYEP